MKYKENYIKKLCHTANVCQEDGYLSGYNAFRDHKAGVVKKKKRKYLKGLAISAIMFYHDLVFLIGLVVVEKGA